MYGCIWMIYCRVWANLSLTITKFLFYLQIHVELVCCSWYIMVYINKALIYLLDK